MNIFTQTLVRLGAAISALSILSGFTKWPDIMFISSSIMLLIWLHAEWDWRRKK